MNISDYIKALQESCVSKPKFTDTILADDKMIRIECYNGKICIREYTIQLQKEALISTEETEEYLRESEQLINKKYSDTNDEFQSIVKRIRRERRLSGLLD